MKYFSVRKALRIAGKTYQPCVCYDLPKILIPTVELLEKNGKARIHDEMVGFMNGKILEKKVTKKPAPKAKAKKEEVKEEVKEETFEAPDVEIGSLIEETEVKDF